MKTEPKNTKPKCNCHCHHTAQYVGQPGYLNQPNWAECPLECIESCEHCIPTSQESSWDTVEEVLMNRVVDITDEYLGTKRKDGYQVYLGYPQQIIDELEKVVKKVEQAAYETGYTEGTDSGHADVVGYVDTDSTDWKEAIEEAKKAAYEWAYRDLKQFIWDHRTATDGETVFVKFKLKDFKL